MGIEPNSTQFGKLVSHLGLTRNWLLATGWVQAYEPVHPYGSLLHQVASLTNTTEDWQVSYPDHGAAPANACSRQSSCVLVLAFNVCQHDDLKP